MATTNPLIWCEKHRRTASPIGGRQIFTLIGLLVAWPQVARFLPADSSGTLLPGYIWATLAVVLAGAAAHAMGRIDDDRRQNRLEVLWSSPVLQIALPGAVQREALRWLLRSLLWVFGAFWAFFLGPVYLTSFVVFPALAGSMAVLGAWVGTATALATARTPLRWSAVVLVGILAVVGPAGLDATWLSPSLTCLVSVSVIALLLGLSRLALRPLLSSSMPTVFHSEKVLHTSRFYRALDWVLMLGMRRLKLHDNAIFRLQRARALRRFSRQPLWFLLALLPAVSPLLVVWAFGVSLQSAMVVLSVLLCFAWWMAGAGATQDSLRSILDSQTMVTLRLTPFDTKRDALALIWGRLYTLALAWLIGLPVWIYYATISDTPVPVLLLPVVCGVLCFMSSLGGVRAACVNLVRNYQGDRKFFSEGQGNICIWVWALVTSPLFSVMGSEHTLLYVPMDMISCLTVALGWPHLWTASMIYVAPIVHGLILLLGYGMDMAAVQEALATALDREDVAPAA